jgi:cation diffusion facilitator CzcD-associated flavoprotein CzcO
MRVNAIVSAVGQLNRPKIPEIKGRERFEGLQGALGGMGSLDRRAEQARCGRRLRRQRVPARAGDCRPGPQHGRVQRSAPWMLPNPIYHERVTPEFNWLVQHVPYYGRWFRFLIFYPGTDGSLPGIRIDRSWPHQERSVNAINDAMRDRLIAYMKSQVGDDEVLLEKVTPKFPVMGKRMLQDNGSWLRALKRSNVELVTEACHRDRWDGHRRPRSSLRRRRDRLRDRVPRDEVPVADGGRGSRRTPARRGLGRRASSVPRHHGPRLPEPVLPVRSGHQSRARRQHHLSLRVPGPLRDRVPEGSARARRAGDGLQTEVYDDYARRLAAELETLGLVSSRPRQLVSQQPRTRRDDIPVAAGRLLELDARPESRGLPTERLIGPRQRLIGPALNAPGT